MKQILITGFGGQGILFVGRVLAYASMIGGKEVTWVPAYGPESRGGTSYCSVIISDKPIGSPIVLEPDILICMNQPSLDKFACQLASDGLLFADSTMAHNVPDMPSAYSIPATNLAFDSNLDGLANMVMLGYIASKTNIIDMPTLSKAMTEVVSARKKELVDSNMKAIQIGYEYNH